MTRKEYAQSMLDQGKTKEETIELVKQWDIDNKPTEVEKPQATATNAAPVVASPTDSTESSSEDTSLDSQNINTSKPKIEELDVDKIEEKEPLKKYVVPKKSIADKGTEIDIIETIPVSGDFNVNFQTDRITRKNLEELNKDVSTDNYDYSSLVSELKNSFEKGKEKFTKSNIFYDTKNIITLQNYYYNNITMSINYKIKKKKREPSDSKITLVAQHREKINEFIIELISIDSLSSGIVANALRVFKSKISIKFKSLTSLIIIIFATSWLLVFLRVGVVVDSLKLSILFIRSFNARNSSRSNIFRNSLKSFLATSKSSISNSISTSLIKRVNS